MQSLRRDEARREFREERCPRQASQRLQGVSPPHQGSSRASSLPGESPSPGGKALPRQEPRASATRDVGRGTKGPLRLSTGALRRLRQRRGNPSRPRPRLLPWIARLQEVCSWHVVWNLQLCPGLCPRFRRDPESVHCVSRVPLTPVALAPLPNGVERLGVFVGLRFWFIGYG